MEFHKGAAEGAKEVAQRLLPKMEEDEVSWKTPPFNHKSQVRNFRRRIPGRQNIFSAQIYLIQEIFMACESVDYRQRLY